MKVALINPGKEQRFAIAEPLNLGFIASYLEKHDVEVQIIDELAGQNVEKEVDRYSPNIVGITTTTPLVTNAYRIADRCREKGILTIIGGVHVSVMPEEGLEHADIVVKGEGEIAMLDIVNSKDIKNRIITRPFIKDIDEVPPPARHLMKMDFYLKTRDRVPESYLYFVPRGTPTAAVLTSRGCPYDCIFCHNTWKNMPYRFHSVERVVSEIEFLKKEYGIRALFFIEDNLFVKKKRVRRICEILNRKRIDIMWGANARVDNIDPELLDIAKSAGCSQITFGFESGSQRILDILNKKTTVVQNIKAIQLCNAAGIIPQGTVIIGNPTETITEIRETQDFITDSEIESVGVCIATPFPGTRLWEWCKKRDLIPDTLKWSDFDYQNVPVKVCESLTLNELIKVQMEIQSILFLRRNTPVRIKELDIKSLWKDGKIRSLLLGLLRNPSKIWALAKRCGI